MTKKILFIVTQSEFGGAQHFLAHLIDGLLPKAENQRVSAIDYEVVVAAGPEGDDESGLLRFLEKKGINTRHLKYLRRGVNPLFDFLGLIEIRKLIKKEKPDTLFLCSSKAGTIGSLAAHLYRSRSTQIVTQKNAENFGVNLRNYPRKSAVPPKVVYRIGGWAFNDPRSFWSRAFYKFIEKISARWKDIIIVNAECHRKQAIELGIKPRQKIVTVYNGIDVDKLDFLPRAEARKELSNKITDYKLRITDSVVGTIANDYPSKGLKYLNKAAKEFQNVEFVIIGTGNRFIPDAYKYLKAFDIFVLPSVKEGFPWTILEAMAAEVPIVATKVGAIPEIQPGLLVEPGNSKELSDAIKRLLENKDLRKKLVKKAKRIIEKKFTLEKMVKEIDRILS